MARNILVLWRWSQAVKSEGLSEKESIGEQMREVNKGDRLYICATSNDELYLLGILEVKRTRNETNWVLQDEFGKFRAVCRNLSGAFKRLPLGKRKWQLRFVSINADRLRRDCNLGQQLQQHRILRDESADLLAEMFGEKVASVEREIRFLEGERRASKVLRSVRSVPLRLEAKRHWGTHCYCCGFSFEEFYGNPGEDVAIIHHLKGFDGPDGGARESSVNDVRIICSNCHYIIHRQNPAVEVDDLRRQIARRWSRWSQKGIQAL